MGWGRPPTVSQTPNLGLDLMMRGPIRSYPILCWQNTKMGARSRKQFRMEPDRRRQLLLATVVRCVPGTIDQWGCALMSTPWSHAGRSSYVAEAVEPHVWMHTDAMNAGVGSHLYIWLVSRCSTKRILDPHFKHTIEEQIHLIVLLRQRQQS